jgi:hypothetical protein
MMDALKPICVQCQRFYRMKKSGFAFFEGMPIATDNEARIEPGTEHADHWKPYKLWSGDLWSCEGCNHHIIVGTGTFPISEHYKPEFTKVAARYGATFQVNDC